MAAWLGFAIPGAVVLVMTVAVYESRFGKRPGTPVSSTYVNEITAMFFGTKRMELDHRDSMSMMRVEDAQGDRGTSVDLDRGVVVVRPDEPGPGQA